MIMQKRYRESVSPDRAVESGFLAMVDGVHIVLKHAKRYDTPRSTRALDSSRGGAAYPLFDRTSTAYPFLWCRGTGFMAADAS